MGVCYLLEFPGGKIYVGATTKTAAARFAGHCKDATRGLRRPLYNAIRKYGPERVTVHTLAESEDWPTLCMYERMFIALFGSQHRALGFNATSGGEGCPDPSEDVRAKNSAAVSRLWKDPAHHAKVTRAACNQKRRSLETLAASLDDYGPEHSGQGFVSPFDFADRLRAAVQASPLGYRQLAALAGVDRGNVGKFATRQRGLRPANLQRLADALGVTE